VSVPAPVASVVHFTGDPSYLRGPIRPRVFIPNDFQGGLDEDERTEFRRQALEAILAYRDTGCPIPASLAPEVLRETMSWLTWEEADEECIPEFLEEKNVSVVVIGCGQSGLLAGVRLAQAGTPFTIIEKNPDVGGTW
jgi:4-hydroxyacetophenone monooxygenase